MFCLELKRKDGEQLMSKSTTLCHMLPNKIGELDSLMSLLTAFLISEMHSSTKKFHVLAWHYVLRTVSTLLQIILTDDLVWMLKPSKIRSTRTLNYLHNQHEAISNSSWDFIGWEATQQLSHTKFWQYLFPFAHLHFVANTVFVKKMISQPILTHHAICEEKHKVDQANPVYKFKEWTT